MDRTKDPARIVAVRALRGGRARVQLNDGRDLLIGEDLRAREGLEPGTELDDARLARLGLASTGEAAHEAALGLLAHRARSAAEIRQRLERRGFEANTVAAEIERLQRAGLLDDGAFANAWVAERAALSPRGKRLLHSELRQRGIAAELSEAAVAGIDDTETATALALRRAARVDTADFRLFASRIGAFLMRRGFDHETAEQAVRTAWERLRTEKEG